MLQHVKLHASNYRHFNELLRKRHQRAQNFRTSYAYKLRYKPGHLCSINWTQSSAALKKTERSCCTTLNCILSVSLSIPSAVSCCNTLNCRPEVKIFVRGRPKFLMPHMRFSTQNFQRLCSTKFWYVSDVFAYKERKSPCSTNKNRIYLLLACNIC